MGAARQFHMYLVSHPAVDNKTWYGCSQMLEGGEMKVRSNAVRGGEQCRCLGGPLDAQSAKAQSVVRQSIPKGE